jgi:ketosteroid isomerase-like protein
MGDSRAGTFIDALRRLEDDGELERMVALYSEDAEVSNTIDGRPHRGQEGARVFWSAYRASFDRIHSEFRNVVESDEAALLEWRSDGRTAAGEDVSYDGVSVVEFDGARITRFRAYFDPHALSPGGARQHAARELTPTRAP